MQDTESMGRKHYDVVVLGAGQAGLSLARQLLLETDKTVLLLDRRTTLPPPRQKVGEATVQVSGYYFSEVLDIQEHLFREHYMKYNLRFYWKNAGGDQSYENYSQSYIRPFSNIPSYQLDRNKLETELLRLNIADPRFTLCSGALDLEVELSEEGAHTVRFERCGEDVNLTAEWVVDATGRRRFLARQLNMARDSPVRHGSAWLWVDGLLNVERLSGLSQRELRLHRHRSETGHLPVWLATNHFAGEGFWVWVIPLQGKTSIGVVYDSEVLDGEQFTSASRLVDWLCEEFPLFARDLPEREVSDFTAYRTFAHDCVRTLDSSKWAITGEAGRFSDPLYSPGGDLIALHNTLIVGAVSTDDDVELQDKVESYESLLRAVYEAYLPSYTDSYEVLGDQEAYSLKYAWELTVYFALYVFPFINNLFTDRRFILAFLRTFSRLGPVNKNLQVFLADYYRWKKTALEPSEGPIFFDFTEIGPLYKAEKTFYAVGISMGEAKRILGRQYENLEELARFIVAHVASVVLGDALVLTDRGFVESLDLNHLVFDPEEMRHRYETERSGEPAQWSFDPFVMDRFRAKARVDRVVETVPARKGVA